MRKKIISFVIIWTMLNLFFILLTVYRDIRINKLFNYLSKPHDIVFDEKADKVGEKITTKYRFQFKATDNFLGAVVIPIGDIGQGDGIVVSTISEVGSQKIIHESVYDYNFFRHFNKYTFGFPVIENSKNVLYEVSMQFTGNDDLVKIVSGNNPYLLQTKFVFPKSTIISNPLKLADIIKNRVVASAKETNYIEIFAVILALSLALLYLSNTNLITKAFSNIVDNQKITNTVFKTKFASVGPFISLILALLLIILLIMNRFEAAGLAANYIWVFLFLGVLWRIICFFVRFVIPKIIKFAIFVQKLSKDYFKPENFRKNFSILLLLVILISGLNREYKLGGDDTRLFYLYPNEFLRNFAVKVVSDTAMSSIVTLAPSATLDFTLLMVILNKFLGLLNIQSMMYTANIIGGALFFYLLLSKLIHSESKYSKIINTFASILYVYSIFNAYTLFSSKLFAIYLVSLFPLCIYLFIKAVEEKKYHYIFLIAIIASVFSFIILVSPWLLAAVIAVIPLILYKLWPLKIRAVGYVLLFSVLMLLLNFHWIIYVPYTSFSSRSEGIFNNSLTSVDFRHENDKGIRIVSEYNSVFYPLFGTYHKDIQKNNGWSNFAVYQSWYMKILPLNILLIGMVLLAGITVKKNNEHYKLYLSSLFSFLVSVYFFTVNITEYGIKIFVWLNNTIPGFVIFRNMYDKFGYAMAFSLSLTIAVSANILMNHIKNAANKKYLILCIIIITLLNIKPGLFGEFEKIPLWTTKNTHISIKKFNKDFIDMVDYISKVEDPGKYLILPLSTGNSFSVRDEYSENNYYSGTSPILALTGKNDFSGILSFGNLGANVRAAIKDKDYLKLGKIFQSLNIKYVIVNKDISLDLQNSFVYSDGFYYLQDNELLMKMSGEKIRDFGQRYSLYSINNDFDNQKIYLSSDIDNNPNNLKELKFKKIDSHYYELTTDSIYKNERIVFLDPYLAGWEILDEYGKKIDAKHFVALGYANGWEFNNDLNLNGKKLIIYFRPYDYYWPAKIVSISGYLFCVVLFLIFLGGEIRKYLVKSNFSVKHLKQNKYKT